MTRILTLLLLLAAGSPSDADIYTWTDAEGVVHYSDTARAPGARPARLPELQTTGVSPGSPPDYPRPADTADEDVSSSASRSLTLTAPRAGETLRSAQGQVSVALRWSGADSLRADEKLAYYLDGQRVPGAPTRAASIELRGVERGRHTLSAALLVGGRETGRSEKHIFYMKPPGAISPLSAGNNDAAPTAAPAAPIVDGVPAAPRFNAGAAGRDPR